MDTRNYFNDIKSVQDILRKDSMQDYYRDTILGFTILKRLMGLLKDTQEAVDKAYAKMKKEGTIDKQKLLSESGHGYYNVCKMTFHDLLSDPQKYYSNTKKMIEGFSDNVTFIFGEKGLDLVKTAKALDDKGTLYGVLKKFDALNLGEMNNTEMGKLFGQLIVMVYGTVENGQNWTPSDFVEVLTKLLLAEGCDNLKSGFNYITLLDNCVGSGQLTSYFEKTVTTMNPMNTVAVYGQDNSDLSIAICKAEQLMVGQKAENFVVADTLKEDPFPNDDFNYILQNAPYGCGRKKADETVIKNLLGEDLPASNDNQMLFWKAAIRKLKDKGRAALLSNGAPLYSGGTSGEGKIRKWLFDQDYVEAIIKLTDQGFIDTPISIFAWIISKNGKPSKRKGWIQIIDASDYYHNLTKGIGCKRKEMTSKDIDNIVNLYTSFDPENPTDKVKYMKKEDFYFYELLIQQPYQRNFQISEDRISFLFAQSAFNSLYDDEKYKDLLLQPSTYENIEALKLLESGKILQRNIISTLKINTSDKIYKNLNTFEDVIKKLFPKLEKKYLSAIVKALSIKDESADTYYDKNTPSHLKADPSLNNVEYVPINATSSDYFKNEVMPFVNNAWFIEPTVKKIGCEVNFNKYFFKPKKLLSSSDVFKSINLLLKKEDITLFGKSEKYKYSRQKIKYICEIYSGNSIPDEQKDKYPKTETTIPYISSKDVNAIDCSVNYDTEINIEKENGKFKRAYDGTTLLCIEGGSAGKKITLLNQEVCFVNKLCAFKPKPFVDPEFLFYLLQSNEFLSQFYENLSGMIGGVSIGLLKEFEVHLPPIKEQREIANRVKKTIETINKSLNKALEEVEILKELKFCYISESVNGGGE